MSASPSAPGSSSIAGGSSNEPPQVPQEQQPAAQASFSSKTEAGQIEVEPSPLATLHALLTLDTSDLPAAAHAEQREYLETIKPWRDLLQAPVNTLSEEDMMKKLHAVQRYVDLAEFYAEECREHVNGTLSADGEPEFPFAQFPATSPFKKESILSREEFVEKVKELTRDLHERKPELYKKLLPQLQDYIIAGPKLNEIFKPVV